MEKMNVVAARVCACGKKFTPPSVAPRATRCRSCHLAYRRAQEAELAKAKAAAARKAEEAKTLAALKEGFLKNSLPEGAVVRQSGRQVVVSHGGRSITFYT